jgi:hypothetical protein
MFIGFSSSPVTRCFRMVDKKISPFPASSHEEYDRSLVRLRLQIEHIQLGPIDRASLPLSPETESTQLGSIDRASLYLLIERERGISSICWAN